MVEKGEKRTRRDKPGTKTIDSEKGAGESSGLGGLRLNTGKLRERGMVREHLTTAKSGRIGRRSRVVPSSHDDKPRHGKIGSDPDRVSDDGG